MSPVPVEHQAVVELDRVAKRYLIGHPKGLFAVRPKREALWALRDVSLRLEPGECVGLIGHNGAGKTTILRLLAGITRPTTGHVRTTGRVASLINLGAGFHPELTGRENIFLNGVILGLSRQEVRARFDEIVEFADLGTHIDTPLKRYSSGMYARLGFAVAAHVDPDVLLVDEVLSVGDVGFQDRSIRKMLSFRDSGQAILLVSHNLSAVEMMCQRTIWLDHGRIRQAGPTPEVVRAYLDAIDEALVSEAADHSTVDEVVLCGADGRPRTDFEYGEPLCVKMRLRSYDRAVITVKGDYGALFGATSEAVNRQRAGAHELTCEFESLPLLPGLYRVELQLDGGLPRDVAAFRVTTDLTAFGSDSPVGTTKSRGGFLAVAYNWRIESAAGDQALPGLIHPRTTMTPSLRL